MRVRCIGAAGESGSSKCAWAECPRVAPLRLCAGRRGAADVSERAEPSARAAAAAGRRGAEGSGWSRGGRMRTGNFLPALEVRAITSEGDPSCRRARDESVCLPPPLPHFRLPPLPRSRLPGPVRPRGDPAQPHPGRRGSLSRPRRRLAGADRLSQRGRRARQVGARRRRAQVPPEGLEAGGTGTRVERPVGGPPLPPLPTPADAARPFLGNSFALADSSAGGAETERALSISLAPGSPLSPNLSQCLHPCP